MLGINLTRDSIGFRKGSSGAWEITNGVLRNASTADSTVGEGAVGCIIDLSALETPEVDEFTLSFDYTMAASTEALFVHVWGYVDHSSSPSTSIMNLGAQNGNAWENASPEKMTAYNFGNPEGVFVTPEGVAEDAAVSLPGFFSPGTFRQTFDLSGNKTAPDTFGAYDYLALGFARSIGGTTAPAATIDNVTISVPTADRYLQWTFDTGLLEAASTADAFLNTLTDGNLLRDSSGWRKSGASAWTVSNGVLQNDSLQNNNAGEGALARVFHLSTVDDLDGSRLLLRFDYTAGDEAEDLFVHLWGYVESETPSLPNTYLMNLGAQMPGNPRMSTSLPGCPEYSTTTTSVIRREYGPTTGRAPRALPRMPP